MRRFLVTAATAMAMAAAPTIASAQQAPAPAASSEVQPAGEEIGGSELKGRQGFLIPLAVLVAIILALLLTQKDEKQEIPTSP